MGLIHVKMFDYLEQYECIRDEIDASIARVLHSGRLIMGEEGKTFESRFSDYLGGGGHSVGVNSGTDAIIIALRALGVGFGDEVITVANTAIPTVSAIRAVGATPVFCDVDSETGLMDLNLLPTLITEKTKSIIPVHLFGNMVDVRAVRGIIGCKNVPIIEDCAQAHGAEMENSMAGTLGDIGTFSFYPTKNLGAYGDAGLCYSRNLDLVREMQKIRMYGIVNGYYSETEGINSRMDEIQAAVLLVKLDFLPEYLKRRRSLARRYHQNLSDRVGRITAGHKARHAYHLYVIKVGDRSRVKAALDARGVDTGIHYPYPIHLMTGYRFLNYKPGSLPVTEALADSVLSLPLYPELSESAVDYVCETLNRIVEDNSYKKGKNLS